MFEGVNKTLTIEVGFFCWGGGITGLYDNVVPVVIALFFYDCFHLLSRYLVFLDC